MKMNKIKNLLFFTSALFPLVVIPSLLNGYEFIGFSALTIQFLSLIAFIKLDID